MRISILPLVIILLCSSLYGSSQQGSACTSTFPISLGATCTNTPIDLSPAAFVTGPAVLTGGSSCGFPSNAAGGKVVYLQFHPNTINSCVKVSLSTNTVTASPVRMEVALFTGTCPLVAGAADANNSMCFSDGSGIWTRLSTSGNWPGYSIIKTYILRVYIADPIVTASPGIIPPTLNICATETTPPNDLCTGAARIDGTLVGGNNVCATGGASEPINANPGYVCAGILQNTVWYKYIVQTAGPSQLTINAINCDGFSGAGSPYLQVGLMIGSCTPALIHPAGPGNSIICGTVGPGAAVNHTMLTLTAPSYPVGTTILVGMDGFLNANCQYNFNVSNAIPIPIRLEYFGAWEQGQVNHTKWVTSSETNNAYFEVQRSLDGTNFESLGRIAGSENSHTTLTYTFDDKFPPEVAYYRLAQFDIDNKFSFSDVVRVVRKENSTYFDVSFTNPVQNSGIITIKSDRGGVTNLQVVDVAGRTISTQIVSAGRGNTIVTKDFSRLVPGTYYLVLIQGESRIVKSFIKQ